MCPLSLNPGVPARCPLLLGVGVTLALSSPGTVVWGQETTKKAENRIGEFHGVVRIIAEVQFNGSGQGQQPHGGDAVSALVSH